MGDLSAHFNRSEWQCKGDTCLTAAPEDSIVIICEAIRSWFCENYGNARVIINSGNRCWKCNERIQLENNPNYKPMSSESKHLCFIAADIIVEYHDTGEYWIQIGPDDVANAIDDMWPDSLGLGRYKTFTHVDARLKKARWDRRTNK